MCITVFVLWSVKEWTQAQEDPRRWHSGRKNKAEGKRNNKMKNEQMGRIDSLRYEVVNYKMKK